MFKRKNKVKYAYTPVSDILHKLGLNKKSTIEIKGRNSTDMVVLIDGQRPEDLQSVDFHVDATTCIPTVKMTYATVQGTNIKLEEMTFIGSKESDKSRVEREDGIVEFK